ncbi:MAG: DUF1553 domain-containing protein [Lentisphaerae bacterium]|nr:DUF1553 domain-containing protein [Lentisphaerota bacterium]
MAPPRSRAILPLLVAVAATAALLFGLVRAGVLRPAAAPAGAERPAAAPPSLPARIGFNEHVQPLLSENCYACHGPDSGSRKAGLRLDRAEFALAQRPGGAAIVPGQPDASPVIRRIRSTSPAEIMPPPDSHKTLTPAQIALMEAWVRNGAAYEEHWSFLPPKRPAVPPGGGANPIDAFVRARIESAGLSPNSPEEPARRFRRAALALTGLPPAPAEADAFAAAPTEAAFAAAVDRMLASPAHAEHMARHWLDVARYADTHGIHIDNYRSIWPYRDWVIAAFAANLPFDRFTVEQLAGDLLPDATLDQQIATGFHRCNPTTSEGGAIDDEYLALYAKDRVETTAAAWLGLTMGCAACHDHKFDPVSQREFYEFASFFRNTTQKAMDGNIATTPPNVLVPAPADRGRWTELNTALQAADAALAARRAAATPDLDRWAGDVAAATASVALPPDGLLLHLAATEGRGRSLADSAPGAGRSFTLTADPVWTQTLHGAAARLAEPATADLGDLGGFDATNRFSFGAWVLVPEGSGALLARMDEADGFRGWDLWFQNGEVAVHLIASWEADAIKVETKSPLKPGAWTHVFATYDGSGKAAGVRIYLDGEPAETKVAKDALRGSIRTATPLALGRRSRSAGFRNGTFRDLRLYGRLLDPPEVARLAAADAVRAALAAGGGSRTEEQKEALLGHFLAHVDPQSRELTARRAALETEIDTLRKRGAISLVMAEKPTPPSARILKRGAYDQPGDEVHPGVPRVLPPLPAGDVSNRLALARWLVAPGNPLTARVTVNRLWQQIFGEGLVATAGDFGITGDRPSHPDLLDWLAVEFVESGWDLRRMVRLMVTSGTFGRAAHATPDLLRKDPANRLLARGPRYRLDGEVLRDAALAAGGLLAGRVGGPSVKPYQPDGIWETVAMPQSDTKTYVRDTGEGLHRRSLYTFWKRSAPPPAMEIFNAPSREQCTVRRERTHTPLQALVIWNDPQFVEAARALAARALAGAADDGARLDGITRPLLARRMEDGERRVLLDALAGFRRDFAADPAAAAALLKVGDSPAPDGMPAGELAAWTLTAAQVMSLDEALTL